MERIYLNTRYLFAVAVLLLAGCGGSGGDSGGGTASSTPAAAPQTGLVRIQSVLARAVPSRVTHFRATGFDANGALRFGPETVPKAPTVEFMLPTTVTRLQLEYLVQ